MASMNQPNLTGVASMDLGLGGELRAQAAEEIKKRKKKQAMAAGKLSFGDNGMQTVANALGVEQ